MGWGWLGLTDDELWLFSPLSSPELVAYPLGHPGGWLLSDLQWVASLVDWEG